MCKPKLVVPLGLLLAMTVSSALGQSGLPCTLCPANANSTGISAGISVQRQSDLSFVNPGESVLPCETLLVNSDAGFKTAVGSQVFAAFVGVTAEMFVNGVSAGSVAPATLTTTRVGPPECADTLDESMEQFTYTIQAADIGNSVLFRMDFAGLASLGGTCGLNVTASPEIEINIISCDDGDVCTEDTCDVVDGCIHTPIVCNDDDACTTDTCDSVTGCVYTPNPPCNDNDACTTDTCDPATGCVFTPNPPCDDNDACTTDTCDPVDGCVYTPNAPCDDADACTTDTCDPASGCVYTPNAPCDDADACTTDTCDPASGCVYTPNAPCDDADACTTDTCDPASGCVYTPNAPCNDNDACTTDTCDPAIGCVFTPNNTCQAGCTPGFWKNCTAQWGCFTPTGASATKVNDVFTIPPCLPASYGTTTLLGALSFQGGAGINGAAQILLRAAAAAVLNACKVGYPLSQADVISQVNTALTSCDRTTMLNLATTLDGFNNLGCKDASGNSLPCKIK